MTRWDDDNRNNYYGRNLRAAALMGGLLGFFVGFLFGLIAP